MKNKISWCLNQKKGIELIDKNDNLSESYIKRAEEDLKTLDIQNKNWKPIIGFLFRTQNTTKTKAYLFL